MAYTLKRNRRKSIDDMTPDDLLWESMTLAVYAVFITATIGIIWFITGLNSYSASLQSVQ